MNATIDVAGKSERAYRWIRERIQRRDYGPGYRLVLASIAEGLDMSTVPVREAVRRLEAEGLVTFERNVGARVRTIDETEYVAAMQALGLVEGFATALSAPLLTTEALDHATALNDRMRDLLGIFDPQTFTRLNREFHAVLYAPCPNHQVLEFVERGWSRLAGIRDTSFAFIPDRAGHSVDEHAELLDLIRAAADPLEIELAARNHRLRTVDALLAAQHSAAATRPDPEGTPRA
jgi:DNA-binding GntR family transcriptional regulator